MALVDPPPGSATVNYSPSEYFGTNFVQIAYSKPKIQSNENIAIFNGLRCHIFNVNFRKTELKIIFP